MKKKLVEVIAVLIKAQKTREELQAKLALIAEVEKSAVAILMDVEEIAFKYEDIERACSEEEDEEEDRDGYTTH